MKKLKYVVLAAFLGLASCEDAIDIVQPGRLSADAAFQSVQDLEDGVLAVYNNFDYTPHIQFNSVFTDQVSIGNTNGGQGIGDGTYSFVINPQSAISVVLWTNYYDALNAASRVIEASALITPEEDETERFNNVLGETYALRAWAHFELLTYFSPDLADDSAPGVIVLNFVPETAAELPRNTTGEVYAAIEADLAQAEQLLTLEESVNFVSKDFVKALRARMAAYRQNYTLASQLATELLDEYPLATVEEYPEIFTDEAETEIIFELDRTIGDSYDGQGATGSAFAGGWAGANFAFTNATNTGGTYFEMSNQLFDLLDDDDIRKSVLVEPSADLDAGDIPIGKYRGSSGQPLMNDLKIFRSSEMLFIAAEAAAALGNLNEAAALIDQLLDARYGSDQPSPSFGNAQQAFLTILEQRRIELAYEGFRWVDLKRLGQRAGLSSLVRDPSDCAIVSACSLPLTAKEFKAIPIPLLELDANENIQQTEGY